MRLVRENGGTEMGARSELREARLRNSSTRYELAESTGDCSTWFAWSGRLRPDAGRSRSRTRFGRRDLFAGRNECRSAVRFAYECRSVHSGPDLDWSPASLPRTPTVEATSASRNFECVAQHEIGIAIT